MSARVLLVNPPPHRRVDQYDEPDFPSLHLACLAGELRARDAATVCIVDAKQERLSVAEILARARSFRPDVVGLTAMTNEIIPAAEVARAIKRHLPGVVTVIGGVHVSVLPEATLDEFPCFDLGVLGEGEETFTELVLTLDAGRDVSLVAGRDVSRVAGLVVRSDEGPMTTPPRPRRPDLDSFADPAWDLFPRARRYLVSTQRGCPLHCPFCVNPNGPVVRRRSVERVVDEMKRLARDFRAEEFYVSDEIFTLSGERTHRLLDAMIAAGLPGRVRWTAATHAGFVDEALFRKMKAAGCEMVDVGVETGDVGTMTSLEKRLSLDEARAARQAAASAGLPFGALLILGHPGETWESARRTIDFAVELNADRTMFGIMVPFPGTRIAKMAALGEHGYRLIAKDWNDYGKQHGNALELEGLSRAELERLQLQGYLEVLIRNRRFRDLACHVWRFRREGSSIVLKLLRRSLAAHDTAT